MNQSYQSYELGPIRPPSEAMSLLLRITRNCPWNKCTFCGVYKRRDFSLRPVEHIKQDIDRIHHHVVEIERLLKSPASGHRRELLALQPTESGGDQLALN